MSDKPQLPKPAAGRKDGRKSPPLEAEKYHKIVLSHPTEAITVTEQERRKRKLEPKKDADTELKTRTSKMVKEEW